jgi:hypothetical protein
LNLKYHLLFRALRRTRSGARRIKSFIPLCTILVSNIGTRFAIAQMSPMMPFKLLNGFFVVNSGNFNVMAGEIVPDHEYCEITSSVKMSRMMLAIVMLLDVVQI